MLLAIAALFSYLNHRFLKLPTTVGLMLIALLFSLGLLLLEPLVPGIEHKVEFMLKSVDFDAAVLHGMLGFLLFAGALHVNLADLAEQRWMIAFLATFGVFVTTAVIGVFSWWAFGLTGLEVPLIDCLLFGALISPTDPVAVLGILKQAGVPKSLDAKITGEALFNDGVAVVAFLVMTGIAAGDDQLSTWAVLGLFLQEAAGGALFGLAAGFVAYRMLREVGNYQVEILITLALVASGYALAEKLRLSAPIAIVVAGLLLGNQGRLMPMPERTREHLDAFWELVDEILNAVLFVLIGLEVLVLVFRVQYLVAGLIAIPIVLLARFISVGLPITLMRRFRSFSPNAVKILTWGGLRGGISIALALSLPAGGVHDTVVAITYIVVVFSILVQGLTIGPVIKRLGTR
ncbi:MAG TPA: sodium:proton antiporter [Burkholderiales bacterium]|nr:sodium:proton antiporter [Burkholderiales bacterium]